MEQPKYQRVLLKLSGEALAGPAGRGIDFPFVRQVCQVVKDCADRGVQVGLVVGGGNYWRGVKDGGGQMERSRADQMGMLATVMNSLALQDVLEQVGQPARVLTSIPMGPVGEAPLVENVAATGIEAGYQTMDVLATLLFGYIILKSALEKGHNTQKSQARVVAGASVVAGIGLLVVYLGLTYLGATMSQFFDITVDRTYLVTSIVQGLLGQGGIILFAVVVALACLTTAVGLVSSCSAYFTGLSKGRISYPVMVFLLCLFSGVVSNFGINEIIAIATPILSVVYPPTLVLIVLALGGKALHRRCWIHRMAALGALAVSLLEVVGTYTGLEMTFLAHLPLADLGFGWALPAAICGLVGVFIPAKAPLAKE